jgi:hypothetical protein
MKNNNIYYNYFGFSVYFWTIISIALFLSLNVMMIIDITDKYYNNIVYGLPIAIFIISIIIINNNINYRKIQLDSDKLKLYKYIFGYKVVRYGKIIKIENNIIVTIENEIELYIDDETFWNDLKRKHESISDKNKGYFDVIGNEYCKLEELKRNTKHFIWKRNDEHNTALIAIPVMLIVNGIYRIIYFSDYKKIDEQKKIIKKIYEEKYSIGLNINRNLTH